MTRRARSTGKKPILVIIFLENTREFPEIITNTGANFWLHFCLSVLALVLFKSPILKPTQDPQMQCPAFFLPCPKPGALELLEAMLLLQGARLPALPGQTPPVAIHDCL